MNTKKILMQLDLIEDYLFSAKNAVEEENWDQAIADLDDIVSNSSDAIASLEEIDEGEVEDE